MWWSDGSSLACAVLTPPGLCSQQVTTKKLLAVGRLDKRSDGNLSSSNERSFGTWAISPVRQSSGTPVQHQVYGSNDVLLTNLMVSFWLAVHILEQSALLNLVVLPNSQKQHKALKRHETNLHSCEMTFWTTDQLPVYVTENPAGASVSSHKVHANFFPPKYVFHHLRQSEIPKANHAGNASASPHRCAVASAQPNSETLGDEYRTSKVQLPDQTGAAVAESHSRVPAGCVWSWPRGPISCAGWGPSSSLALSCSLRLSPFTAGSALAAWCAPQPPPWPQLHNHQQLSSCICPPACVWRKRDSAGLHSAQIPPSADTVNIQTLQLLHWHAVIKRQSVYLYAQH